MREIEEPSFNQMVRDAIQQRGITQRYVAMLSGVDHSTISRIVNSDRDPQLRVARKIAKALNQDLGVNINQAHPTEKRPNLP